MTTDRPDTHHDADRDPALQNEFWGGRAEWTPSTRRRRPAPRARVGGAMTRWWETLLAAGANPVRRHGHGRAEPIVDNAILDTEHHGELDVDHSNDIGDAWEIEPEPRPLGRPGVDPLLARFGGLAVIITLAVPAVMGFTSAPDGDSPRTDPAGAGPIVAVSPSGDAVPTSAGASTSAPPTAAADGTVASTTPIAFADTSPSTRAVSATAPPPTATAPPCGNRYELAAGDYWIRIADAVDVSLAALLEVNEATTETVLVPGRSICLPVGAATPNPPTTTAAPTTVAPTTVAPRATDTTRPASTTAAPTTTAAPAPATTVAPRPPAVSRAEAEAIIRSVWPDELEDRALEIAWRESNYRSDVNNWCCYGLFQIHWTAHRSWLGSLGISAAAQLWDARVNTEAAFALYQRSGGFGPWGG